MARFELKLPKMGESVAEATITNWLKQVGDKIEMDEAVLEIATDKVDSEVPSEVSGILVEQLFNKDDLVQVGQTIAIIETEGGDVAVAKQEATPVAVAEVAKTVEAAKEAVSVPVNFSDSDKFFSPLVKNIAKAEGVSVAELESISGSGKEGRVTKEDLLKYVADRKIEPRTKNQELAVVQATKQQPVSQKAVPVSVNGGDEIIEMDRMRKLISGYMVASVQTSAHVQSFIEVDVTNIVKWRNKVKDAFEKREGEKLTFTPIMMEAVAKALKDFPGMNISVDGDYIIKKKNINLGMAAALPNGNLIVPVIKNADQLNLVGMAKAVNDLGNRAKAGKLKPDDTQGGTYTVTNVGTFGSVFGTPIINQPQVGILALGAIRKVPAVIETPEGDFIGIRQKMFLSHSYDHRVVDGALGGSFVKRVADYLEAFDVNRDF
ncbi:diapophytoene dehydrogenase [Flavobacterium psychrophilum]|jgi:2-oxoglutarate dehydrogenase E2 component (dihydrolipoamide succinyltransferase)|uniref:Dihydrolipoamide acetyltransferase component of pyruvate dehydrogenase complex n=6 Tax=Flavobacterium psychrophilum TaxID=96345 RepID=A6GX72_FLAPJ|nr:dihydrolipoamide acetyltransferase family protein [Flavobacterium psychrophilum]AIG29496.1 diapophytoene dehydrogenase [Flavobacterium psychrophilum]AIG31773.1 diapophytoene dehydrogenase [Flavobacterium psychrophilum]AIG33927.1 diapophytoene dehydrogenase [Flavobacterium psychrophilum]AIG36290.1 diapophytoene dehydrogenase [Flavobacterium psychrophilum]AIG38556.1 diapophytoene dehydrogenase [Flavobacterium psychrophilum]